MDRFSSRLAASLIEDRHREAAAARRFADVRPGGPSAAVEPRSAAPFDRILRALPIRRAGGR